MGAAVTSRRATLHGRSRGGRVPRCDRGDRGGVVGRDRGRGAAARAPLAGAATLLGIAVAFAALAYLLYADPEFSLWIFLVLPLAIGVAVAVVIANVPPLYRAVTRRRSRESHAMLVARALFVEREIHATRDRTGVLVYIAVLERCVVLVPDLEVRKQVGHDVLGRWRVVLEAPIAQGGQAVARALAALAVEIGAKLPRRADDTNELPDAVSLPRGRRAVAAPAS